MPDDAMVWVAGITIGVDISRGLRQGRCTTDLHAHLLDLPAATTVEGPTAIAACVWVTFQDTALSPEELCAHVRTVVQTWQTVPRGRVAAARVRQRAESRHESRH